MSDIPIDTPETEGKRSVFLTFLCILTWIGCAIFVVFETCRFTKIIEYINDSGFMYYNVSPKNEYYCGFAGRSSLTASGLYVKYLSRNHQNQ